MGVPVVGGALLDVTLEAGHRGDVARGVFKNDLQVARVTVVLATQNGPCATDADARAD